MSNIPEVIADTLSGPSEQGGPLVDGLSQESVEAEIESLKFNVRQLQNRVRHLEKLEDTMNTPLWKRIVFMLDGWPLFRVVEQPQWRPWRRWWTS